MIRKVRLDTRMRAKTSDVMKFYSEFTLARFRAKPAIVKETPIEMIRMHMMIL